MSGYVRGARSNLTDDARFADDPSWNGGEKAWCPTHRRDYSLTAHVGGRCPWCTTDKDEEAAA